MINQNSNLSHKQMQEMLPDYVFERLSISEKAKFESSLPKFPDIQEEVNEVRAVFNRFEKTDVENTISSKARNMSVKVNNKLNEKESPLKSFKFAARFVIPTVALAFMVFTLLYSPFSLDEEANSQEIASKKVADDIDLLEGIELFTEYEKQVIIEESFDPEAQSEYIFSTMDDIIVEDEDFAAIQEVNDEFNRMYEEMLLDEMLQNEEQLQLYLETNSLTVDEWIYTIETMDEDDFQILLEDLSNEDILS